MEYNRAKMKQEVKRLMKETRPRPIWITLLYMLIVAAGTWIIQMVIGGVVGVSAFSNVMYEFTPETFYVMDPEHLLEMFAEFLLRNVGLMAGVMLGGVLISLLSYLWSSLMVAGYTGYTLRMVRRQNPDAGTIFSGFGKFGKVFITNILVGVFTCLWGLLFAVIVAALVGGGVLLTNLGGIGIAIGIILCIVAYVVLVVALFWLTLRFALVNFLVMDRGVSGLEALTLSKQLMKGNKRRLFVLHLSFIGWYLLEMAAVYVCMGGLMASGFFVSGGSIEGIIVGVILMLVMLVVLVAVLLLFGMWLTPYNFGAVAMFYEYTLSGRPDLFPPEAPALSDESFGTPNYPKLD